MDTGAGTRVSIALFIFFVKYGSFLPESAAQ